MTCRGTVSACYRSDRKIALKALSRWTHLRSIKSAGITSRTKYDAQTPNLLYFDERRLRCWLFRIHMECSCQVLFAAKNKNKKQKTFFTPRHNRQECATRTALLPARKFFSFSEADFSLKIGPGWGGCH